MHTTFLARGGVQPSPYLAVLIHIISPLYALLKLVFSASIFAEHTVTAFYDNFVQL